MASKPYPDHKRAVWRMKYRPDPLGKWVSVVLGKDPRLAGARPPKTPPQFVLDRAQEFREIEYRAKFGMARAPRRAKGLEDYLLAYIDSYSSRRAGSVKQLTRHVRSFLAYCKTRAVVSLQAVDKAVCRDYLEFRSRSVKPSTLKTERGYLVGIWTRAVDDGLIAANPWHKVKPPGKAGETEITFWSQEEIKRIIAACRKDWHRDLTFLLASTGLRISTALEMEWGWVDWGDGVIRIKAGPEVKTAYAHKLSRRAHDFLQRKHMIHKGDTDLVFPNSRKGGRVPYDSARDAIARAIERAGVKPGTPHDLRHSYARLLVLSGAPITVVQSQLGHTSLAMTMRYTRTTEEHAARFVEDFGIDLDG